MNRTEQAERYERYAAECVRLAQNTADAAERAGGPASSIRKRVTLFIIRDKPINRV